MTAAESQSTMKLETAKVQPITVLPEGLESLIPNPNLIHLKKAQSISSMISFHVPTP